MPDSIKVPAGNHPFLEGHGVGTQHYVCAPSASSASGVAYVLFTPQATLFSEDFKQLTSHFFSPSPSEANTNPAVEAPGAIRATWRHSRDSSTVWGKVRPADPTVPGDLGDSSTDQAFVATGAVAWLKVTVTATEVRPTGGDTLKKTTFIQQLNTAGGLAPSTGCAAASGVGHQAFVPYQADYLLLHGPITTAQRNVPRPAADGVFLGARGVEHGAHAHGEQHAQAGIARLGDSPAPRLPPELY